jgi:hypothetical protein
MLPMVEVPETLRKGLRPYRDLFRRAEGFEHVSRYVTGLIVSPNKTLQGIYAQQVWEGRKPTRRAMHEAVFEAGWEAESLLSRHRVLIGPDHRGQGREVIVKPSTSCEKDFWPVEPQHFAALEAAREGVWSAAQCQKTQGDHSLLRLHTSGAAPSP